MKKVLLSLSGALIAFGSFAQLSGTYTIDGGSATGGTNYQTFSAAVSALGSSGINGPVTFNVDEGTYSETVNFPTSITGSSSTNVITFQSDGNNTANPVITSSSYVINMGYGALNNITFRDLDLIGTSSYCVYIYAYNNSSYSYRDIMFEGCQIEVPAYSGGTYPVYLYGYYGGEQSFTFDECQIKGGYYGIYGYLYQANTNCEVTITNSEIVDFYYMSAYIYGYGSTPKLTIKDNYIHNSSASVTCYGMYTYYAGPGSEISGNTLELDNSGTTYGFYLYYAQGTSTERIKFHNNMISCANPNGGTQYGMMMYYTQYTDVHHNSLATFTSGTAYTGYIYGNYATSSFANNLLANMGGNGYSFYGYSGNGAFASMVNFNNNAYTMGGSSTEINNYDTYSGASGTTIGQWQSACSADANSVAADPSFQANNDLHSLSLAMNNAGAPLGITTDIDGQTRSTSTPDIGADEFSVPTNNAQPGDLITPDAPLCSEDTTISIMLMNPGLVALTSCSLNYSINGGTPVSNYWTGNIPSQSDTLATVESSISFSSGDQLLVWTSMPNGVQDSATTNDTVGVDLYNGLSGTYAIPADYATISDARNDLELKGICGDVIFNIAAGTYNESVSFGEIDGTSENATVTFQSASGNWSSVKIENASGYTIDFGGADWITFKNVKVFNTNGNCFTLSGSSDHVTVDGCWAKGAAGTSTTTQSLFYMSGTGNDLTLANNRLERGATWFYSSSGSTTAKKMNLTIEDNDMKNQTYYGAYIYYFDGVEVNRNSVRNDSAFQYGYGYYALGYYYYCDNFNITKNYVGAEAQNGYYYAMYLYNCVGSSNPRSQISNNCITTGNATSPTAYYALYLYSSGLVDIYNNSFTRMGNNSSYGIYIYQGGAMNLVNNSIANMGPGYAMYVNGGFAINTSDYNNIYNTSGQLTYFGSSTYNSLEDHQAGSGQDMHSVVSDPNWEDWLTCTTCNDTLGNAGTVLSNLTDDIDGNVRSVSTPDIGAVEYVTPASFSLGGDDTICGNEAIVEAGPAQSVTWNVNNQTSTQSFVTLTATTEPVTYNVSVNITTEFCGSGSDAAVIRLVPNATLDSSDHICADETLDLEPGGSSAADYTWSTGATTATITVDEAGTYSVTKMEDGCESSTSIVVSQSAAVEITDLDACADDLPLTIDATIANGTSYAWSGGSSINNAANTFSDAGSYSVTATDSYGCSSDDDFQLTVLETPEAAITETHSGNAWFFDGTSSLYISSNTTYLWDFGYNGQTASTANATANYPWSDPNNPTTYTVTLTIDNGCGTDVTTMEVTPDPLGIGAIAEGSFGLYPNPAADNVNFVLANEASAKGTIEVMDVAGRVLSSQTIAAGQTTGEVNVSDLTAGSYIVKISVDGASSVNALIKQ
ncbi:MAG TPA: hypothetical protein DCX14_14690 [Flavobacteriales bacterium]|nr:hypothetical protein [Flavobacteriales bacterium]